MRLASYTGFLPALCVCQTGRARMHIVCIYKRGVCSPILGSIDSEGSVDLPCLSPRLCVPPHTRQCGGKCPPGSSVVIIWLFFVMLLSSAGLRTVGRILVRKGGGGRKGGHEGALMCQDLQLHTCRGSMIECRAVAGVLYQRVVSAGAACRTS